MRTIAEYRVWCDETEESWLVSGYAKAEMMAKGICRDHGYRVDIRDEADGEVLATLSRSESGKVWVDLTFTGAERVA